MSFCCLPRASSVKTNQRKGRCLLCPPNQWKCLSVQQLLSQNDDGKAAQRHQKTARRGGVSAAKRTEVSNCYFLCNRSSGVFLASNRRILEKAVPVSFQSRPLRLLASRTTTNLFVETKVHDHLGAIRPPVSERPSRRLGTGCFQPPAMWWFNVLHRKDKRIQYKGGYSSFLSETVGRRQCQHMEA